MERYSYEKSKCATFRAPTRIQWFPQRSCPGSMGLSHRNFPRVSVLLFFSIEIMGHPAPLPIIALKTQEVSRWLLSANRIHLNSDPLNFIPLKVIEFHFNRVISFGKRANRVERHADSASIAVILLRGLELNILEIELINLFKSLLIKW